MILISAPWLLLCCTAATHIGTKMVEAMLIDHKNVMPLRRNNSFTISNVSNTVQPSRRKNKKRNTQDMAVHENYYKIEDESTTSKNDDFATPSTEFYIEKLDDYESSSQTSNVYDDYTEKNIHKESSETEAKYEDMTYHQTSNGYPIHTETTYEYTTVAQTDYGTYKMTVVNHPTNTETVNYTPQPITTSEPNDSTENESDTSLETNSKNENNTEFDIMFNDLTNPGNVTASSETTLDDDGDECASTTTTPQEMDPRFCAKYKNGQDINLKDMADIWRVVYYDASHRVTCFKMIINKIYKKDKKKYSKKTERFSDRIDWGNCHLEIIFGVTGRTHILQESEFERGVFKNIIYEENRNGVVTLIEESLDQWMLFKDLLLLRDCNSGEIVVFARGSTNPSRLDVNNALVRFGEDPSRMEGLWSCNDDKILAQRIRKWVAKALA